MFSSIYSSLTGATGVSAPPSTPSTPPPNFPPSTSSPAAKDTTESSSTAGDTTEDLNLDATTKSPFYKKLIARNQHPVERLEVIKSAARKDTPPREPAPEECCGEACGLECVTTMWWEEEKTWRDLHPSWRSIKARIAAEEEDRRREREEEEALNELSSEGRPNVEIGIEKEETEEDVMDMITSGWKG